MDKFRPIIFFLACECNEEGSDNNNCDASTGQCTCQDENIVGRTCDETPPGYYDFPTPKGMKFKKLSNLFNNFLYTFDFFLLECECNEDGSVNELCDEASGKCTCKENVIGDKCTQCATEFWGLISNCEGK